MPSQPHIPPLLSSHLSSLPPVGSLTLLTSVLNASANWLLLRFIYAVLRDQSAHDENGEIRVILVSWLRDWDGWRGAGRRMGIDFQKGNKVTFVDGLGGKLGITEGGIAEVEKEVLAAIGAAPESVCRTLLVMDGLDFLLAATGIGAMEMLDMICELREHVHASVVTASADYPLVQARNFPLEIDHATFVLGLAHQARVVMGLRGLDTGVARDVSGVLRITRGGEDTEEVQEKEILYFVEGDGSVKVFERGA